MVGPIRIFHRVEGGIVDTVYVMRSERDLRLVDMLARVR